MSASSWRNRRDYFLAAGRFTADEAAAIERRCAELGMPRSRYVRDLVLADLERQTGSVMSHEATQPTQGD